MVKTIAFVLIFLYLAANGFVIVWAFKTGSIIIGSAILLLQALFNWEVLKWLVDYGDKKAREDMARRLEKFE